MEKWNLDLRELNMVIQNGLPVYNPDYELEDRGPIYNETPNPNYDPNDWFPQKYIVEKNNLYDFQLLLETPFPIANIGLTKDQILSNLLFKKEDVENYEKGYGLNRDSVPKGNEKGSDFKLFDSMVSGDMRPFLSQFSSEDHIKKLLEDKYSIRLVKASDGFIPQAQDFEKYDRYFQPGDRLSFNIEEIDDHLIGEIRNETNDNLEELIDIDIPPPPDLKSEYFLSQIEDEYESIKRKAKSILSLSTQEEQISLFANKNIQRLKEIARQGHVLSKKLGSSKGKRVLENSNDYIISILKLFLIRSILYYQELFQPFLKIPLQDEYTLRTELFGERPFEVIVSDLNRRLMEQFYKKLGHEIDILEENSSSHSIQYFKNLAMNEDWRRTSANQAVSVDFVGLCQLKLIMATDNDYLRDSQNLLLIDIYDSVIKEEGPSLVRPKMLDAKKFKYRLGMWINIIDRWTDGNYPRLNKRSSKSYLELYNYDCELKKLETKPIKNKFLRIEKDKQYSKEDIRKNQAIHHNLPVFIKLSDLRHYLNDEIGIPLPPLLFPIQQDFEYADRQIKMLRSNQKARIESRKIAKKIWNQDPKITIKDMIEHSEIIEVTKKKNGIFYTEKTVRDWIKDLSPNRSPGRPKKNK